MHKRNISTIHDCYGCGVCATICPKKIISIHFNKDGFYEPFIERNDLCIDCGLCLSVCSFMDNNIQIRQPNDIQGYAAWSKDEKTRKICSSGGAGFEIGRHLIENGYKAIGVRYNPKKNCAEHYLSNSVENFIQSIGSKYIQSYTVEGFSHFNKKDKFLVTGTPCQIDSIRRYIKKIRIEEHFVLMDFFCHGVPSMLMWKKYTDFVEEETGSITSAIWRDKQHGWQNSYVIKIEGEKGYSHFSELTKGKAFYNFFLGHYCLGKQCHKNCKYKNDASAADIRIGDLWGNTYRNNQEGVSSVLALTQKGKDVLLSTNKLKLVPQSIEVITEGQMKKCATPAFCRPLAMTLLKGNMKIMSIAKICNSIEFISHLPIRVFNKIKNKSFKW